MSTSKTASGKKPEQEPSSTPIRPRQLVSTACQSCREKRVKCDGPPPPCEACLHRKTECIFNVDQDQRRRLARKHKLEDMEFHKKMLFGLLETIRSSNEAYMQNVVEAIRSNASMGDIMAVIDDNLALAQQQGLAGVQVTEDLQGLRREAQNLQRLSDEAMTRRKLRTSGDTSPESSAQASHIHSLSRSSSGNSVGVEGSSRRASMPKRDNRRVMAVRELVDTPPWFDVPAKPWTRVTESDQLVSHLVSLYFAWWNPNIHALDRNTFVNAMKSRDLAHPLCSPFLVNAVLALASQLCDFPRVFLEPNDIEDRGAKFHSEAQRLWINEDGRNSITNMQGLVALISSACIRGKDRAGWLYLSQLIQMHNDLSLSERIPAIHYNSRALNEAVHQAYRNAAWANFNISVQLSLSILKVVAIGAPRWGMPFSSREEDETIEWTPYPNPSVSRRYQEYKMYNCLCDLMARAWRLRDLRGQPTRTMEFTLEESDVEEVIVDLKRWRAEVPACVEPSPSAPASAFNTIMAYYWVLMTLVYLMASREGSSPGSQASSSTMSYRTERTRALIFELLPIHRGYHQLYGYEQQPWFMAQTALMGCNTLLRMLDTDEDRAAFAQLCDTLLGGGRKWPLWAGTVLMLRPTARELGVQLPARDDAKLRAFEDDVWTPDLPLRFSSMFPNYAFAKDVAREQRDDDYEMGSLLDRWTKLHFSEAE